MEIKTSTIILGLIRFTILIVVLTIHFKLYSQVVASPQSIGRSTTVRIPVDQCPKYIGRSVITSGVIKKFSVRKDRSNTYTALYMFGSNAKKPLLLMIRNYEFDFFNCYPKDFIGKTLYVSVFLEKNGDTVFAQLANRSKFVPKESFNLYKEEHQ